MSVFVVDNATYNKIAGTLDHHKRYGQASYIHHAVRDVDVKAFVQILRVANYASFEKRYREPSAVLPIQFTTQTPMNQFQLLKSLDCIRYQIEVKHQAEDTLEQIISGVQREIISNLPQYNAANWG